MNVLFPQESYNIIGAAMEVHKILGCGFTEPIYQEALGKEMELRGIPFEKESTLHLLYKGIQMEKTYRLDFLCYNKIVVELKAVSDFTSEHYAQVYNYLRAGNYKLGLLINFAKTSLEYERIIAEQKWNG